MKFSQLSEYLSKLEATTKRLEITDILTNLINETDIKDIDKALYLSLGCLSASYEAPKFNIAEKMLLRVLAMIGAESSNTKAVDNINEVTELYNKLGDLGDVTYEILSDNTTSQLTIQQVHIKMLDIANTDGAGSQELKVTKTAELLRNLDKLSAKYCVRIILGTMRLGFSEITVADALAKHLGNKEYKKSIEGTYNIHPDIGLIAKTLLEKGIEGLSEIKIETGVPIQAQKPQRVADAEEAIERMENVIAEFKFDGTRVQLHIDNTKGLVKTYTRNLEETTTQFPDIVQAAKNQLNVTSAILDGEGIGYNKETGALLIFQETMKRKRKHGVEDAVKDIPLKYFVFDILYLNGESLIDKPLSERREILSSIIKPGEIISIDEALHTSDSIELGEYFETARSKGLEGLVVKKPEDPYQAGARSYSWVKLKKSEASLLEDSVDCVVLGYYFGRGSRTKLGIGGFLVGVIDQATDTIKTVTKIGTRLSEDQWIELKNMCDKLKISAAPGNINVSKKMTPDVWVAPKIVVEVGADELSVSSEHTAGYALRFPRLLKFRPDKNASEATTTKEIEQMYKLQKPGNL